MRNDPEPPRDDLDALIESLPAPPDDQPAGDGGDGAADLPLPEAGPVADPDAARAFDDGLDEMIDQLGQQPAVEVPGGFAGEARAQAQRMNEEEPPAPTRPPLEDELQAYYDSTSFTGRIGDRLERGGKSLRNTVPAQRIQSRAQRINLLNDLLQSEDGIERLREAEVGTEERRILRDLEGQVLPDELAGGAMTAAGRRRREQLLNESEITAENLQQLRNSTADDLRATIQEWMQRNEDIADIPQNPAARRLMEGDVVEGFAADPLGVIGELGLSSLVQTAPSLAAGAAGTAAGGPAAGAAAGGAATAVQEFPNRFMEQLGSLGVDVNDPDALQVALQDPALVAAATQRARRAAGVVGAAQTASFGLAGRTPGVDKIGNRAVRGIADAAAQTTGQAALGAAGEAGAQLASDGDLDRGAIAAEFIGEFFGAPAEAVAARLPQSSAETSTSAREQVNAAIRGEYAVDERRAQRMEDMVLGATNEELAAYWEEVAAIDTEDANTAQGIIQAEMRRRMQDTQAAAEDAGPDTGPDTDPQVAEERPPESYPGHPNFDPALYEEWRFADADPNAATAQQPAVGPGDADVNPAQRAAEEEDRQAQMQERAILNQRPTEEEVRAEEQAQTEAARAQETKTADPAPEAPEETPARPLQPLSTPAVLDVARAAMQRGDRDAETAALDELTFRSNEEQESAAPQTATPEPTPSEPTETSAPAPAPPEPSAGQSPTPTPEAPTPQSPTPAPQPGKRLVDAPARTETRPEEQVNEALAEVEARREQARADVTAADRELRSVLERATDDELQQVASASDSGRVQRAVGAEQQRRAEQGSMFGAPASAEQQPSMEQGSMFGADEGRNVSPAIDRATGELERAEAGLREREREVMRARQQAPDRKRQARDAQQGMDFDAPSDPAPAQPAPPPGPEAQQPDQEPAVSSIDRGTVRDEVTASYSRGGEARARMVGDDEADRIAERRTALRGTDADTEALDAAIRDTTREVARRRYDEEQGYKRANPEARKEAEARLARLDRQARDVAQADAARRSLPESAGDARRALGTAIDDVQAAQTPRDAFEARRALDEAISDASTQGAPDQRPNAEMPMQVVQDGRYGIDPRSSEDGIRVVNLETGRTVDGRSAAYEPAVREYLRDNAQAIEDSRGRTVEDTIEDGERLSLVEYLRRATDSDNPAEIAEAVAVARESDAISAVNDADNIVSEVLDGPRISTRSFDRVSDPNLRRDNPEIALRWLAREGKALDTYAQELSQDTGRTVTEQDIIDIILEYPTRRPGGEPAQIEALRDRFREVTGVKLTDSLLDGILDDLYAQRATPEESTQRNADPEAPTPESDDPFTPTAGEAPFQRRAADTPNENRGRRAQNDLPQGGRNRDQPGSETDQVSGADSQQRAVERTVRDAVAEVADEMGLPRAAVIADATELPEPARVAFQYARDVLDADVAQLAMYFDGQVYLLTDYMAEQASSEGIPIAEFARRTFLHETAAHQGIEGLLGDAYEQVLAAVYDDLGPGAYEALMPLYQDQLTGEPGALTDADKALLTDELLATRAETLDTNPSLWAQIRDALRRAWGALSGRVTDADLDLMLRAAADHLRGQQAGNPVVQTNYNADPRFRREDQAQNIEEVRDADGNLLAPNGEPSNLNEVQWKQVRTPAFKDWFGDWENDPESASKVVDANGEPQVVYHGTPADVATFDRGRGGENTGLQAVGAGFYFTPDAAAASTFANAYGEGSPNVMPVFLSVRNPIRIERPMDMQQALAEVGVTAPPVMGDNAAEAFTQAAERAGYDGVILEEGSRLERIAFSPEQVKSATGNRGTFDAGTADIRFQRTHADGTPGMASANIRFKRVNDGPAQAQAGPDLFAVHNLRPAAVEWVMDKMSGWLPAPSIAVTDADAGFDQFGDISLIGGPDLIDPAQGVPVFGADAYTPTTPSLYDMIPLQDVRAEVQAAAERIASRSEVEADDIVRHASKGMGLLEEREDGGMVRGKYLNNSDILKELFAADRLGLSVGYKNKTYGTINLYDALYEAVGGSPGIKVNEVFKKEVLPRLEKPFLREIDFDTKPVQAEYIEAKPDRVADKMTKDGVRGQQSPQLRALAAERFANIESIQERRTRIDVANGERKFSKAVDAQWSAVREAASEQGLSVSATEDVLISLLEDTSPEDRIPTRSEVREALQETFGLAPPETRDLTTAIHGHYELLRDHPTDYFEAKPKRAVHLGEFKAAVVPEDTPQRVVQMLKDAGLRIERTEPVMREGREYGDNRREVTARLTDELGVRFRRRTTEQAQNIEEVRDADGNLLAPNGEPSNLNELQWKQVRTPAFKDWFGDWENDPESASKVVDANGEPQVVYHGTALEEGTDRNVYDGGFLGEYTTEDPAAEMGLFFAESRGDASYYAGRAESRSSGDRAAAVESVFLDIKDPAIQDFGNEGGLPEGVYESTEFGGSEQVIEYAEDEGHDGVALLAGTMVDTPGTWIALEPTQIKSATRNKGAFDPRNSDVRFQRRTGDGAGSDTGKPGSANTSDEVTKNRIVQQFMDRLQDAQDAEDNTPEDGPRPGRPELANPASDDDVRTAVDAVDETRKPDPDDDYEGRPDQESFELWRGQAGQMLADDYEGTKQRLFDGGMEGAADVMAAKQIINDEGLDALESGDPDALTGFALMVNSYREQRTEQARALAAGRDPEKTPEQRAREHMVEAIVMPDENTNKKLNEAETDDERDRILNNHADKIQQIRDTLEEFGINPATMNPEEMTDPRRISEVLRTVQGLKSDAGSMLYEYWRNAILSSFSTMYTVNTVGTLSYASYEMTIQRWMNALVNQVLPGDKGNAARFGEISRVYKAINGTVLKEAWRRAILAFETEAPVVEREIGYDEGDRSGRTRIDPGAEKGTELLSDGLGPRVSIPDTVGIAARRLIGNELASRLPTPIQNAPFGRIIRWPMRTILALDEMYKSIIWSMEKGGKAYRIAKQEGLEGEALEQRVQELSEDPFSEASMQAFEDALKYTAQDDPGKFAKAVLGVRREKGFTGTVFRYNIPFLNTPARLLAAATRKSLLGTPRLLVKAARHGLYRLELTDDAGAVYRRREYTNDVAEQVIAWAVLSTLPALVIPGDDDELPYITGTPASYRNRGKKQSERRGAAPPPMSIRIGDTWYSYVRLDPFATPIAITVDTIRQAHAVENGKDVSEAIGRVFQSLRNVVHEQPFLQGMSDILRALESDYGAVGWATRFVSSWSPNILRSSARNADDKFRDYRAYSTGREYAGELLTRTAQRAFPFKEWAPPPRVDLWGRESMRYGRTPHETPLSTWIYRITVPSWRTASEGVVGDESIEDRPGGTPIDRMLMRWNNENPTEEYNPSTPRAGGRYAGETYRMTSEEYHDFLVRSGRLSYMRLQGMNLNIDAPTQTDIDKVKHVLERTREQVRRRMINEGAFSDLEAMRDRSEVPDPDIQMSGGGERIRVESLFNTPPEPEPAPSILDR